MPPVGLEPTILVSERPKTHVLDRAAIGIALIIATNQKSKENFRTTVIYRALPASPNFVRPPCY
jgi:hypothetical protein